MRFDIVGVNLKNLLKLFPLPEHFLVFLCLTISVCLPDEGIEVVYEHLYFLFDILSHFWRYFPFHFQSISTKKVTIKSKGINLSLSFIIFKS